MKTFLEYVAEDLLANYGTDLSRIAVVFPNKRASLFLNEYLARLAGRPIWSPAYITISELFRQNSSLHVADPIKLVCDLHKCFTQCTGIDETLDHFYGWGQILVADFDDVDKNMAPADRVFANLRDLHELDDVSYLTDEQRDILRRFFSNFSDDHNTVLKQRFLSLWSHIGDIYHLFRQRLADQQLAYEGALYREVAERETLALQYDTYVFVGFNLLQQVEQELFSKLKRQGRARFYWDFDDYYMKKGTTSEAGHYISQYLSEFPNELDSTNRDIYANFSRPKTINYISAPTENIQARYISHWLDKDRIRQGRKTAIVLADEKLLQTVIHCLPDDVEKANITTGYPLAQTPAASLINVLFSLQTAGFDHNRECFRLHFINHVLRHPYARFISGQCRELSSWLTENRLYYPDPSELHRDEALTRLFTPASDIIAWMMGIVRCIARNLSQQSVPSPFDQEALFRMYTLLNRLHDLILCGDLVVDVITLQRLVTQLISTASIPFHGEPAEGIQVMGVLETRNIDFDHVLVLSCNEGNLPKGVSDTSFIPYSIRKAYGLTTIDHKVAIYAYYFHHLLQRAADITLVYNNSTTDGHTGEMSRFMLQMMVESGHPISRITLQSGQESMRRMPQPIEKTDAVVQLLRQRFAVDAHGNTTLPLLTPTGINRYMRCPLRFFYYYVSDLKEPDGSEEDIIDNKIFGNIFHHAAENIYKMLMQRDGRIVADDIDRMLKTRADIERAVDAAFMTELFRIKDASRRMPPLDGLQIIHREVIIKYMHLLLETDRKLAPFTILGLEKTVSMPYVINDFTTNIGGIIDRLDCIVDSEGREVIRVVDYKTGSKMFKDMPDVEAIFSDEQIKNHSDYYLQTFLYSHIVRRKSDDRPVRPALLFIQHTGSDNFDPVLTVSKQKISDIAAFDKAFMTLFDEKVQEIFNPSIAFMPTSDRNRCRTCPYAGLCGF